MTSTMTRTTTEEEVAHRSGALKTIRRGLSLSPELRRLGVGWVRFENMKWPFVSPEPHKYAFDGSVGPWHVNTDEILRSYRQRTYHKA